MHLSVRGLDIFAIEPVQHFGIISVVFCTYWQAQAALYLTPPGDFHPNPLIACGATSVCGGIILLNIIVLPQLIHTLISYFQMNFAQVHFHYIIYVTFSQTYHE